MKLCPECEKRANEYQKAWRKANRDKVREYNKRTKEKMKLSTPLVDSQNSSAIIKE